MESASAQVAALEERLARLEVLSFGVAQRRSHQSVVDIREDGGLIRSVAHVSRSSAAILDVASQSALLSQRLSAMETSLPFSIESRVEALLGVDRTMAQLQEDSVRLDQLSPLLDSLDQAGIKSSAKQLSALYGPHSAQHLTAIDLQERTASLAHRYGDIMRQLSIQFALWSETLEARPN